MESSEQPNPQGRDVTLDEALEMAVHFQQRGQLAEAEEVFRTILAAMPDEPVALHYSGVLAHQLDRHDEALSRIERSLAFEPGRADWHSNLGIVLKATGRIDDAAAAFRRAIALSPTHVNAHSNLGVLLKAQGRLAESEAEYRRAIELDPSHTDAYHNLGVLLSATGRSREAVLCYCKVTTLSPHYKEARRLLALAHCTLGEDDKAVAIYEQWLAEEPDNPVARHMLAACSGQGVPARASDAFVEKVFDDFAVSFDSKLAALHYRAPALVEAMLKDSGIEPRQQLDVLDAGCGTGLCGPLVAPWARRLVGVDLSAKMLERAQHRLAPNELAPLTHVYDELCHAELTSYLQAHPNEFDLIVSADTIVYFGDLDDVLGAAATALREGGVLIFTVEDASALDVPGADEKSARPFHIDAHGRYAHRHDYVERTLATAGMDAAIVRAELRMEAGVPVKGLLVRATRPTVAQVAAVEAAVPEAVTHG
ncbi:MAG: tetratricopeptide repeat protein [Acidobacteria bacterium]|nr:tetratricopeptide repeat protein [Acidobacteriota bacterium]